MKKIQLICPSCSSLVKSKLIHHNQKFICSNIDCEIEYPIINRIPVLLDTAKRDFHGVLELLRGRDGKIY